MTALEIAVDALKEIQGLTGSSEEFQLIHEIVKEALGDIRRAQYLETETPSALDVRNELFS